VAGNHNIKVADFGLAKDIYTSEYYRSEQGGALPVKWMSPESLLDNYFDEKTDVVCAIPGVVLEIFRGVPFYEKRLEEFFPFFGLTLLFTRSQFHKV